MRRQVDVRAAVLAGAVCFGATPIGSAKAEAFKPVTPGQLEVPVLPAPSAGPPRDLEAQAQCDALRPGVGVVAFRWRPGAADQEQRIDITAFHEGFKVGRYQASPSLPAGRTAAAIERPEPGVNYYWRVLTRTGVGWAPSPVERFEAPTCPVDSVVEREQ